MTLARSLRTAILTAKPDHKTIADSDVERWSRDIGLMLRLDGRSRERIEAVLAWLPSDDFWPPNIQSGKSWLLFHLALCLASGLPFLGRFKVNRRSSITLDAWL